MWTIAQLAAKFSNDFWPLGEGLDELATNAVRI